MIALLQRVHHAEVSVDNQQIAAIKQGLLAFIGVEKGDKQQYADKLIKRVLNYRVFSDAEDKMNHSLLDIAGDLLLVPQFTLAADTRSGLRPSFSSAAPPADGKLMFDYFCCAAQAHYPHIQTGQFGADMQVSLTNNGPVTFWLQVNN